MKTNTQHILNANQAVAKIAYKTNEVCPIYPITPASEMSELVEQWSSEQKENIFKNVPAAFEMQSEAGVAGAMHGALQTGSLSTTFTASQGLLLMMPNMYKIAAELTPNVIHVATRSIATHALSVYSDHSDIMAVRSTGYAMLGASSVQEAQDFALISQAATLKSHIPFVHFFDGFRTSHETNKIETISDAVIKSMIDTNKVQKHRDRALNPNNPIIRGTSQNPDVFFQHREATNTFYNACPRIVQNTMNMFGTLTGRSYNLFDYVGHPKAEYVIISMASSTETIEKTIEQLNTNGAKLGLIKVRLFRPFSTIHLIEALPETVKSIAVLDRTKESGATGGPLYLDIIESLMSTIQNHKFNRFPTIVGGRYGLSSKEFTPNMVKAIFNNLNQELPMNNFTVGINDDVTNLSLPRNNDFQLKIAAFQAIFYQSKNKKTSKSYNETVKLIGNTSNYIQSFTECDYNKLNSRTISHLRIDKNPIKAPYLITNADIIVCQNALPIENDSALDNLKPNGTLLVNTSLTSKSFWQTLSASKQYQIIEKNIQLYIVNNNELYENYTVNNYSISGINACFLALKNDIIESKNISILTEYIYKVDTTVGYKSDIFPFEYDDTFSNTLLGKLLANKGNDVPVSMVPVDGTYPSDTSKFNPAQNGNTLPEWQPDACTQCGACSMACPQGVIRINAFNDSHLENAPRGFKSIKSVEVDWELDLLNYTIQIQPEQCTSCNNCVDACPAKALIMKDKVSVLTEAKENWKHFESIPEFDRTKIDVNKVSQQQLQEPLFKYALGDLGCGEAPYLKLMSQLFGDRLLIANATGSSSIFGGALPTTPWSKNKKGKGPSWSNSLFEDNAEFGLGYRLSLDNQEKQAKRLLKKLLPHISFDLAYDILNATQSSEEDITKQSVRIKLLNEQLKTVDTFEASQLLNISESLVKKSVWIVGGDGWAYDIGFGGLDHVIASGKNVNILVLDNEVYDNTGGQSSKATPFGVNGKFSYKGKQKQKKDLGKIAMTYDHVYVASVAIGANQEQTLKAFNEAESYDGPSIIIAYSHSAVHGIDMNNPSQYHKAAVNSDQWLMYRNDPRKQNNFQLDSKLPTIKIEEYLKLENRFNKLFNNQDLKEHLNMLQNKIEKRYLEYYRKSVLKINKTVDVLK